MRAIIVMEHVMNVMNGLSIDIMHGEVQRLIKMKDIMLDIF